MKLDKIEKQSIFYANLFIVAVIMLIGYLIYQSDSDITEQVKNGEVELHCATNDDWQQHLIDSNKVMGYNPGSGYWVFTNGFANNCSIKKVKQ